MPKTNPAGVQGEILTHGLLPGSGVKKYLRTTWQHGLAAALKNGIRNPETEKESRKRKREQKRKQKQKRKRKTESNIYGRKFALPK